MSDAARPRAVRLAFLVESGPAARAILDSIFAACYGMYGGRFAIVVPCREGQISEAYWCFLEASDPDLIYSYIPISEALEQQIHERLYPSSLLEHSQPRAEDASHPLAYKPRLPIQSLSSLSLLPSAARGDGLRPETPLFLIDGWQLRNPGEFIMDNFGTRAGATGNWRRVYPEHRLARSLSFVPSNALGDPRTSPREEDAYFEDPLGLLARFRKERIIGVAQLSAGETRRLDYRDSRWSEVVNVFLGEGFDTRVAFWNSRHLIPAWLDGHLVSWRVSPGDLEQEGFAQAFVDVVQRNGYVRSTGGGSPHVRIISVMDDCSAEEAVAERLRGLKTWCSYSTHHVSSLDECAPTSELVKHAYELEGGRNPVGSGSSWYEMTRVKDKLMPPVCAPRHLADVPTELRTLREGWWAIDCDLQRSHNLSIFSNVQDRWRLPRRLRMAHAFVSSRDESQLDPRVNRTGLLTIYGTDEKTPYELVESDDDKVFRVALTRGRPWPLPRKKNERLRPNEIALEVMPSDCGRYLTGVIHQFDGLHRAQSFLLHEFWADELKALGASVKIHAHMVDALSNKLKKQASIWPHYDLRDPEKRRILAEWALREASRERRVQRYQRFDALKEKYSDHCQRFASKHPPLDREDDANEQSEWNRTLVRSVQYLCRRQVLHQGYEWRCRRCLHKNWISIDRLAREQECGVCGEVMAAPVDQPWEFRLNEFVHRAIRDQGVLPLLWVLHVLQDRASSAPMCFLGPTVLYFDGKSVDARSPNAEVDLLVVLAKEVVLVEAKSSVREVSPSQLIVPSRRIRPDRVVLAIMEKRSAAMDAYIASIRQELSDLPTQVELITLEDGQFDDSPWLPAGPGDGLFRVRL
jgi:hypothetical protein